MAPVSGLQFLHPIEHGRHEQPVSVGIQVSYLPLKVPIDYFFLLHGLVEAAAQVENGEVSDFVPHPIFQILILLLQLSQVFAKVHKQFSAIQLIYN